METADEGDCNFWWCIELETIDGNAEETLMTIAELSGSVGSELLEECEATILRAVYLSTRDISHWLAELDALGEKFPGVRVRSHSRLENQSWHTDHLDSFPPIPVGAGLVVSAPWHTISEPGANAPTTAYATSRLPIYIWPGSAFGTGYHESTHIALSFVERFVKERDVIIDVGTGSGILFIAGLKLGAAWAVARDTDPNAVEEAVRNMKINRLPDSLCDLRIGNLLDGVSVKADLLTSNIMLQPNLKLLGGMKSVLKPSGIAIFSGMTATERAVFLQALSETELSVMAELTISNWWGCAANWDSSERSGA